MQGGRQAAGELPDEVLTLSHTLLAAAALLFFTFMCTGCFLIIITREKNPREKRIPMIERPIYD